MWRLVFSKRSYLLPYVQLYSVCWMMCHIFVGHHWKTDFTTSLSGYLLVIKDHRCSDTIERLYYSAGYEDVCIYSGTVSELVDGLPTTAYPICTNCQENHEPITFFNSSKVTKGG